LETKTTETEIAVKILNRMAHLGHATDKHVAQRTGERSKCSPSAIRSTRS
jgi:hypothetical protein